ncbi:MAG: hypothetical protein JXR96_17550 [Deltaproteobacteria bacterium]|nr:hypothetical protein [Deltaproteobacteria bacterium]
MKRDRYAGKGRVHRKQRYILGSILAASLLLALAVFWLVSSATPAPSPRGPTDFLPVEEPADGAEPGTGTPLDGPPEMGGGDAQPSPPSIALIGTIEASDPRWSSASIRDIDGKTALYRIGDVLPDGSTLVAVRTSSVVIRREGRRAVLSLSAERGPAGPKPAPAADEAAPESVEGIRPDGPDRFRLDREACEGWLARSNEILRDARISLVFGEEGGVEGVQLGLLRSSTLFSELGLRDGDVLHRVGSCVIDSPAKLREIGDLLRHAREIDVELSREGALRTLRYRIE